VCCRANAPKYIEPHQARMRNNILNVNPLWYVCDGVQAYDSRNQPTRYESSNEQGSNERSGAADRPGHNHRTDTHAVIQILLASPSQYKLCVAFALLLLLCSLL